jgi:hypothetical protein
VTLAEARIAMLAEIGAIGPDGKTVTFSHRAVAQLCDIIIFFLAATWEQENSDTHHSLQLAVCNLLNIAPDTMDEIFAEVDWSKEFPKIAKEARRLSKETGVSLEDFIKKEKP